MNFTGLLLSAFLTTMLVACTAAPLKPLSDRHPEHKEKALSGAPLILAHGGSAGDEPLNSLAAIKATLKRPDYDGIEIDIVLTGDSMPVLAHDPWLSSDSCHRQDGKHFDKVQLQDIFYAELVELFECRFESGDGNRGAYHPLVSLPEVLALMKAFPDKVLYLDLKIQEGKTLPVDEYAAEIYQQLLASDMSNEVFIEVPESGHVRQVLEAFEERSVTTVLSYPAFYAGEDWDKVGAVAALKALASASEPLDVSQEAGAAMVMSPAIVMPYRAIRRLHDAGVLFGTFLVTDDASLQIACDHGADLIISDIPPATGCEERR